MFCWETLGFAINVAIIQAAYLTLAVYSKSSYQIAHTVTQSGTFIPHALRRTGNDIDKHQKADPSLIVKHS